MKCDFSMVHYMDCLDKAIEKGYKIGRIKDWATFKESEKYVLLRHDVDFNLDYAVDMACWEAAREVKSTYYILMQSEYYNSLQPDNVEKIKTIHNLGHEIGLHINGESTITGEHILLENIIGEHILTFSHHLPLQTSKPNVAPYLIDCRDSMFSEAKFISDSCRNWREGCMCNFFEYQPFSKLQILTHPIWWMTNTFDRDEAIRKIELDCTIRLNKSIKWFRDQIPEYLERIKNEKKDFRNS